MVYRDYMQHFVRPLKWGNLTLPSNIFYASLSGCSNYPFRQIASLYQPGLMFCEMVKMEGMIHQNSATYRMLDYNSSMRPIGAQLCGNNPKLAASCARIVENLGFDVIDLNCGCPVDKVTKDGSGAKMLQNPELIGEVLANMVAAVAIPVTVKIRIGWDNAHINAPEITKIAEQAGAKAIFVHGRTREQKYKGRANWDSIRICKEVAASICVIGNGDLFTAQDTQDLFVHSQCDGVLISRGILGQPWIAENIRRLDKSCSPIIPDMRKCIIEHMECICSYQTEHRALREMRKVGCWYLRNSMNCKKLREAINRTCSLDEMKHLVLNYETTPSIFNSEVVS